MKHLYHAGGPAADWHCAGCPCRPLGNEFLTLLHDGECPFEEEVEWRGAVE